MSNVIDSIIAAVPERDVAILANEIEASWPVLSSADYVWCSHERARAEASGSESAGRLCLADRRRLEHIVAESGQDPAAVVARLVRSARNRRDTPRGCGLSLRGLSAAARIARRAGVPVARVVGDYLAAARGCAVNAGRLHLVEAPV